MPHLQAAIFDMDGVIINTVDLHFSAWKKVFDPFLQDHAHTHNLQFREFTQEDYWYYVDGISREDGIRSFLTSRHIKIQAKTVSNLAQQKNKIFLDQLKKSKIQCFDTSIDLIKNLKTENIKIILISASKNCKTLLKKAGIEHLFELIIDGNVMEQNHLPPKPHPDIFINAAQKIKTPSENIMIIEDALLGVKAAQKSKAGLIIGIDRNNLGTQLFKEHGADIVVKDVSELQIEGVKHWFSYQLVHIFDPQGNLNPEIETLIADKNLFLFLDYDGTLTPIVDRPELAKLNPEIKTQLNILSHYYQVAIISGRALSDIQKQIGLRHVYYAGNHGLEIKGPNLQHIEGQNYLDELQNLYQHLQQKLAHIPGILIENKKFSLSVHYRLVAETEISHIHQTIKTLLKQHPNFIRREGKKVFEIHPNINWHKGKAVSWFLQKLKVNFQNTLPIYLGDDASDEDAFRTLKKTGLGIIICQQKQPTKANFCLRNLNEVKHFLNLLIQRAPHEPMAVNL